MIRLAQLTISQGSGLPTTYHAVIAYLSPSVILADTQKTHRVKNKAHALFVSKLCY